jgi:hypothetical protein
VPTVIDSLVLELGMDARKFEEGERAALVTIDEFKRHLQTFGETAQEGVSKVSNVFMALRGGIFGLIAALGVGAIGSFVEKIMLMDAQTSRLARSLSTNTRELSIWQGVLKQVGGTAEQANAFFTSLADSLADIRLGISTPSGPFAFVMSRMGLDIRRATPETIAERLPAFVQQQRAAGMPEVDIRALLRQIPGMNDATIFAALRGDFTEMRKSIEAIGPLTQKQGEAAEKLVQKQGLVETAFDRLASKAMPALEAAIDGLTAAFKASLDAWTALTGGIPATAAPAYPRTSTGHTPWLGGPLLGDLTGRGVGGNNPGHIPYGSFAAQLGATGADRNGLAIFPSAAAGAAAAEAFEALHGSKKPTFRGSATPGTFQNRFPVPGPQTSLGGRGGGTTVNVASINVTSNKADARAVAAEIPDALQRRIAMVMSHDTALTG